MNQRIKIVHYWAGYPRSANSKWQRFLALIQRCNNEGWRNYLVWSKLPDDKTLVQPFESAGCKIILQPRSNGNFDFCNIWRIFNLLRQLKCDIFHCHNDHTTPLIAATLARVPLRIWSKLSMSSYYEKGVMPKGLQRLHISNKISSFCCHQVMALTKEVKQEYVLQSGAANKTIVVPAPIEFERFAYASGERVREKLGIVNSDLIITTVGHAVPVKGWDILVESFCVLAQELPNVHLLLIGSTTSPEEARFTHTVMTKVNNLKLQNRIHLLGHRADIPEILKASDIFVFPSRSDGQGLALVEAMAVGLPCVASNVGGIPDVLTNGVNGFLFEREDQKSLTDYIRKLINDKSLRIDIGKKAAIRAGDFTMEKYVEKIIESYRLVLMEKKEI